ncbi:S9 family peptidase [Lichenibacterium dinghuense]|uniref:S9 family peptidase n=1 Tax=Lichenibacterium dinghuense TaxID=2895977 RepID=UPI001F2DC08D|nr:S9 family peptidase [Lichenibacterium sp. 6Y81]
MPDTPAFALAPPSPIPARPVTRSVHDASLTDDFGWIRADNWREVLQDPAALPAEVRALLDRENAHTAAVLAPTEALQERLAAEMQGRMDEEEAEVPVPDGPFSYYSRYREGGQHELVCRVPRDGGPEQVMLDGDALAEGLEFFEFGDAAPSDDHALLAWGYDDKGSELHTIKVRDLATGEDRTDAVPDSEGSAVWTADGTAFFYVRLDEDHRASSVWLHRLGTEAADDRLIYDEEDPAWFVEVSRTRSGRFAVISIHGHDASEARVVERTEPFVTPRLIAPRTPGLHYEVDHRGDDFVILTNADGAVDFKIVTAPVDDPGRGNWRDLVSHEPGRLIVGHAAFARHLVRLERRDALPHIVVRGFEDGDERAISFPEEAYSLGLGEVAEQDTAVMRFTYSSMTTPTETWDYDMDSGERTLRKRQEVPSGHDPADYVTRRILARAEDGAEVPVTVLHHRDTPVDGSAPLLLYGYGAYGYSIPASFGTKRLSLVDRGFVYAIAHIRGGTDKGWAWYTDGKLANKVHSFTDFIAAGRALAAAGYTAEGRIVAQGGSAGGLLMGAVANMAPALFAGIVADVPFVDVLNTILDDSLPLTPPEWLEWGDPIRDAAAFDLIRSYSPYDNVVEQRYPPILALGGLTDPRVTYWEPAKWVAKLRQTAAQPSLVLLKTNMGAGHGGASGRFDQLDEVALQYAFALGCVGREAAEPFGEDEDDEGA